MIKIDRPPMSSLIRKHLQKQPIKSRPQPLQTLKYRIFRP